eukprot:11423752-Karenia_brevis.AAC.1
MPDGSYGDKHVEMVYTTLSGICNDARDCKRHVVIGGDFNAEVGSNPDATSKSVCGKYGLNRINARGR